MNPHSLKACLCLLALYSVQVSAQTLRDPTRPAITSQQSAPLAPGAAEAPQVGLSMVVTAKEGVLALFNGKLLRTGDRIEAGVVVRIAQDAMFVRNSAGLVERLPLYPGLIARPQGASTDAKAGADRSNRK